MKRKTSSSSTATPKRAPVKAPAPEPTVAEKLALLPVTLGDRALVKPVAGRRIIDIWTGLPLPAEGLCRKVGQHWLRCYLRGEVELLADTRAAATVESPKGLDFSEDND